MKLIDINKAKQKTDVKNGLTSVSSKLVYFGHPLNISNELRKFSVKTVCCINHGAMLAITKWEEGELWRCPTCNEGAIEIK